MVLILLVLVVPLTIQAAESDYVKADCMGIIEFRLDDGTRVDCLDVDTAWEYDFAPKWAEAIGQSLHYSRMTGKKPGIVLIMDKGEHRFIERIVGALLHSGRTDWELKVILK